MSNNMEPRAIIIVWQGKEVPDDVVRKAIALMADCGAVIPEMVTTKQFDADGLTKCLGGCINIDTTGILDKNDLDPIYNSIVFIGTYYKECIANPSAFALQLSADLSTERYKRATGKPANDALMNAVEILATKTISTNKYSAVLTEYGMKKNILEVIHTAYRYYNNVFVS